MFIKIEGKSENMLLWNCLYF